MDHVAVVGQDAAHLLETGERTVLVRFLRDRRAPFGRVSPGDEVWCKLRGGPIIGRAQVRDVHHFAGLTAADLRRIERMWAVSGGLAANHSSGARYATAVDLQNWRVVRPWQPGIRNNAAWIVLDDAAVRRAWLGRRPSRSSRPLLLFASDAEAPAWLPAFS